MLFIALEVQKGTYNGDMLVEFLTCTMIPQMCQFDGSSPRSVLVMDNSAIHHVSPALKMLSDAEILVQFLPPCTPDLEELFSYVKYYHKEHDGILQAVSDSKPFIKAAFSSVTIQDCLIVVDTTIAKLSTFASYFLMSEPFTDTTPSLCHLASWSSNSLLTDTHFEVDVLGETTAGTAVVLTGSDFDAVC